MTTTKLTAKQTDALTLIAGAGGTLMYDGPGLKRVLINGNCVRALRRGGLVTDEYRAGQGWHATITEAGRAALAGQ